MRKIYACAILILLLNFIGYSQTISPLETDEYCPNTIYNFTITLPSGSTNPTLSSSNGAEIILNSISIIGVTVTFKGKFVDYNQTQSFKVDYNNNGSKSYPFTFKKIKSLV